LTLGGSRADVGSAKRGRRLSKPEVAKPDHTHRHFARPEALPSPLHEDTSCGRDPGVHSCGGGEHTFVWIEKNRDLLFMTNVEGRERRDVFFSGAGSVTSNARQVGGKYGGHREKDRHGPDPTVVRIPRFDFPSGRRRMEMSIDGLHVAWHARPGHGTKAAARAIAGKPLRDFVVERAAGGRNDTKTLPNTTAGTVMAAHGVDKNATGEQRFGRHRVWKSSNGDLALLGVCEERQENGEGGGYEADQEPDL